MSLLERRLRTITHGIETALLACYDNVCHRFAVLPSLWSELYTPISVEHLEEAIRCVSTRKGQPMDGDNADATCNRGSLELSSSKIVL